MLVRTTHHLEIELLRWLAILALATALALAIAPSATGMDTETPPLASPRVYQQALELTVAPSPAGEPEDDYVTAWKLWRALAHTEAGDWETSLTAWRNLRLPGELDAWRQVAIAASALHLEQPQQAIEALYAARDLQERNPLAAYYLGLVRARQGEQARQWYDALGPRGTLFIAAAQDISPNTREMYQRAAREALHDAIAWASELDRERSLMDVLWVETDDGTNMPLAAPTVRNLLIALGEENFVGHSHQHLGRLYLQTDAVETAENHLDQAYRLEAEVRDEYRALGRRYELLGRPLDAARAHIKAMRHGGPIIDPMRDTLRNLIG